MGTVLHKSSKPSQLSEKKNLSNRIINMPPIVDDEVIDAAAAEETEDAVDGKAAEAEASEATEEVVEEKKGRRRSKRIMDSINNTTSQQVNSERWCFFQS